MYDDLVKRLREADTLSLCGECGYKGDKKGPLFAEAADAIEELTGFMQEAERDRDEYRERLDKANDAIEELSKRVDESIPKTDAEIICGEFHPKPMTNAMKIRAMTDEELAELFWIRADCELCPNKEPYCSDDCKKHWLDWLKGEAQSGNNT